MRSFPVVLALVVAVAASTMAPSPSANATGGSCLTGATGWHSIGTEGATREAVGLTNVLAGHPNVLSAVTESWKQTGLLFLSNAQGLFRSDNCGSTWSFITSERVGLGSPEPGFFGAKILAFSPHDDLYVTPGVAWFARSRDYGATWAVVRERPNVDYNAIAFAPDGTIVAREFTRLGGRSSDRLSLSTDGGETFQYIWNPREIPPGIFLLTGDRSALTIYASAGGGRIVVTSDLGQTSTDWAVFPSPFTAMALSIDRSRFWVATRGRSLWRSRDMGVTWDVAAKLPGEVRTNMLVPSKHDPRALFLITDDEQGKTSGELWFYREPAE